MLTVTIIAAASGAAGIALGVGIWFMCRRTSLLKALIYLIISSTVLFSGYKIGFHVGVGTLSRQCDLKATSGGIKDPF